MLLVRLRAKLLPVRLRAKFGVKGMHSKGCEFRGLIHKVLSADWTKERLTEFCNFFSEFSHQIKKIGIQGEFSHWPKDPNSQGIQSASLKLSILVKLINLDFSAEF